MIRTFDQEPDHFDGPKMDRLVDHQPIGNGHQLWVNNNYLAHRPPVIVVSCTGTKVLLISAKAITDLPLTRALFVLAYLCLFLVGITGNALVIWVVWTCKNMQTVTNLFIANLAVSDLIVCCTSIWLTPSYTYIGHWIWGGWLCYAMPIFQGASIFISSLTLTAIALDRHWVICLSQPRSQHTSTSKQVCVAVICLIWGVSLLMVLPYAVHMRIAHVKWPCNFSLCVEDWGGKEALRSLYGIATVVLQFVVPFIIVGRSYRRIWHFLENHRMVRKPPDSDAQLARKRRLLSMLIRMVLVFGICWLPFNLLNLLRDLRADYFLKPYFSFLFLLAHLLSMVVPAANPLIYAWMNASFRDAFLRVLPFRLPCNLRNKLLPPISVGPAITARTGTELLGTPGEHSRRGTNLQDDLHRFRRRKSTNSHSLRLLRRSSPSPSSRRNSTASNSTNNRLWRFDHRLAPF